MGAVDRYLAEHPSAKGIVTEGDGVPVAHRLIRRAFLEDHPHLKSWSALRREGLAGSKVAAWCEFTQENRSVVRVPFYDEREAIGIENVISIRVDADPYVLGQALDAVCSLPGMRILRESDPYESTRERNRYLVYLDMEIEDGR